MVQTVQDLLKGPHPAFLEGMGGSAFLRRLIAFRLQIPVSRLFTEPDYPLGEQASVLRDDLQRLENGCPAGYIFGEVGFLEWEFYSDERALCPREETAFLADWLRRAHPQAPKRIVDLGCGSGVIGLSLALSWPESQVTLVDLSPQALALTRKNVERHNLSSRARLVASDWWNALTGAQFELVVANPPYVASDDEVEPGVLSFEPHAALFSDEQGMADIKAILTPLDHFLAPGGMAALECGHYHHKTLQVWLQGSGLNYEWLQDPYGVPRYLIIRKELDAWQKS
ncbi:MAG: peptide chain release factor N(5)-glutamine methyltransferase [Acidobacteria bacterium]|nr:peptide chain release factor N(5)-glutamine methyltransferase [Acidobacteriota bacterium]MCB9397405.1 peptide chain release factor N(5)-glutamine methyltransferase [Acidobacteriota bacterium]